MYHIGINDYIYSPGGCFVRRDVCRDLEGSTVLHVVTDYMK